MANKNLFASFVGRLIRPADAVNDAGGTAYRFVPTHALAQLAVTGCLRSTYYASDVDQLARVLELAREVDDETLAKIAVFARTRTRMKDMPALLLAVLSVRNPSLFARVFPRVIDNARMLRTFVQIVRSGVTGRKSLGTRPKRMVAAWLDTRSDDQLFRDSVGQSPSLADVVKMVHPRPTTASRKALYGYLVGRSHPVSDLPPLVRELEDYKRARAGPMPDVPFQMLTALDLGRDQWSAIARQSSWQTVRMNLNTFARHGVFDDPAMVDLVANRLSDRAEIERAKVFPYQLLVAHRMTTGLPDAIRQSLALALEHAVGNVPRIEGKVFVLPDVSGSMQSPVTGRLKGATSAVRCIDVAALVAAAFVRRNPLTEIVAFDDRAHSVTLDPRASLAENAESLARLGGGGTSMSAPLVDLTKRKARGHLVVVVSDNESWLDASHSHKGTETMRLWNAFRAINPDAKLVCIDLQPNTTTQAYERGDILNVGGFSDDVFEVIARFASGSMSPDHWLAEIDQIGI